MPRSAVHLIGGHVLPVAAVSALLSFGHPGFAADTPSDAPDVTESTPSPAAPDACASSSTQASPPPASVDPAEVEKRLRELEEISRRQQELIRQLQATVEALQKQNAEKPATDREQIEKVVDDKLKSQKPSGSGFVVQPNPDNRLRLRGLIHMDQRFFPSEGGRTTNETFLLRRIRTVFSGTVAKIADFQIQPIFDEGKVSVLDAFADVRIAPQHQLRFGLFKTPYSLERLQSAQDLRFIERSIAQNLAPNRDVGLQLHGGLLDGKLDYQLAVLNGAPDSGNVHGDAGRDKDFAGRIFAHPFKDKAEHPLRDLGIGLAATIGDRDESQSVTFRTAARQPFFQYLPNTLGDGTHRRLAPQFYYFAGPFGLMGEYYLHSQALRRAGQSTRINNDGWFLQGSYVLTGEKSGFRSPTPRRPFNPSAGHWGAFELAFRYSQLRIDPDAFRLGFADPNVSAEEADAWTVGLNWYLNEALKFQLNYERVDFDRPIRFSTGSRDREETIITRFQLAF